MTNIRLPGTPIEDSWAQLTTLARRTHDEQRKIVHLVVSGEVSSVREALADPVRNPEKQAIEKYKRQLSKESPTVRSRIRDWLIEEGGAETLRLNSLEIQDVAGHDATPNPGDTQGPEPLSQQDPDDSPEEGAHARREGEEDHPANGASAEPGGSTAPVSPSNQAKGGKQSGQSLDGDAALVSSLNVDLMMKDDMVEFARQNNIDIPGFTKKPIPEMNKVLKEYLRQNPTRHGKP